MARTITLPDDLEEQLLQEAEARQSSVEEVALDILHAALEQATPQPTVEEVVARIKGLPHDESNIRPAHGSLAAVLRQAPHDPEFDLARWNEQWAAVEEEIRTMTQRDDLAEGRG